jgi:hypothetical protein
MLVGVDVTVSDAGTQKGVLLSGLTDLGEGKEIKMNFVIQARSFK